MTFQYKPDSQIIVYLLEKVYGMEITKLFEEKLLSHFTHRTYQWSRDNIENMKVSVGLLNDFRQLMLNKGTVGEERLFTESAERTKWLRCFSAYSWDALEHISFMLERLEQEYSICLLLVCLVSVGLLT